MKLNLLVAALSAVVILIPVGSIAATNKQVADAIIPGFSSACGVGGLKDNEAISESSRYSLQSDEDGDFLYIDTQLKSELDTDVMLQIGKGACAYIYITSSPDKLLTTIKNRYPQFSGLEAYERLGGRFSFRKANSTRPGHVTLGTGNDEKSRFVYLLKQREVDAKEQYELVRVNQHRWGNLQQEDIYEGEVAVPTIQQDGAKVSLFFGDKGNAFIRLTPAASISQWLGYSLDGKPDDALIDCSVASDCASKDEYLQFMLKDRAALKRLMSANILQLNTTRYYQHTMSYEISLKGISAAINATDRKRQRSLALKDEVFAAIRENQPDQLKALLNDKSSEFDVRASYAHGKGRISPLGLLGNNIYYYEVTQLDSVIRMVDILLSKGANPNDLMLDLVDYPYNVTSENSTAIKMLKRIMKAGADINRRDSDGMTPIMHSRHSLITKHLLGYGAELNLRDHSGLTVIHHWASDLGLYEHLDVLEEEGLRINPDITDSSGETALFYAARSDNGGGAYALIEAGADRHFRNRQGDTPRNVAINEGHQRTADMILYTGKNAFEIWNKTDDRLKVFMRYRDDDGDWVYSDWHYIDGGDTEIVAATDADYIYYYAKRTGGSRYYWGGDYEYSRKGTDYDMEKVRADDSYGLVIKTINLGD